MPKKPRPSPPFQDVHKSFDSQKQGETSRTASGPAILNKCHVVNFEFTGWVYIQDLQHDTMF